MQSSFNWADLRTPAGVNSNWQQPAQAPQPGVGEVHLWLSEMDQPPTVVERLLPLLSVDERERAFRFRFEALQRHSIIAHAFLRMILAQYLQTPPEQIRFENGEYGKPALSFPVGLPQVQFNLSHSGSLALIGVGLVNPIGVDIEKMRPLEDVKQVAERFFAPEEQQALCDELPAGQQTAAFYACWTRKEAFLKVTGRGLSQPLDGFTVSLKPDQPARLLHVNGDPEAARTYHLQDIPVPAGYRAALAVAGTPVSARLFVFHPALAPG